MRNEKKIHRNEKKMLLEKRIIEIEKILQNLFIL